MNIKEVGYMMTQYEKYGSCGIEEYKQYFIDEVLKLDESNISDYNEYLINNNYEPYYDDLELMLEGFTPFEIVQKTFYGKFENPYSDYFQFNGYENIDTFSSYEVLKEMKNNSDFIDWYIKENNLIDPDDEEIQEAIKEANRLIKLGY